MHLGGINLRLLVMSLEVSTPAPLIPRGKVYKFGNPLIVYICVIEKDDHVWSLISEKMKGIQMSLSENIARSDGLNQNTLHTYELSKGRNSRMTEYITLENPRNYKKDDQSTKKAIFARYYSYN